jgi:nitronate monooxygenase
MTLPKIIQGGMGVAISDWRLAKTVSQTGQMGVVSGTGLSRVLIARLMDGDKAGHVRRALAAFPFQDTVELILQRYFIEGGKAAQVPYKSLTPYTFGPSRYLNAVTVIANFVEVYLAKEGHAGVVGINLLEKVQMPNIASLYGAMLAGVDYVLMGAGIPMHIPAVLDQLARHEKATYRIDVANASAEEDYHIEFDPEVVFPGASKIGNLKRPAFLPIISSFTLAQALLKRAEGSIEGFIIEGNIAGGHNAPPRGPLKLNEENEPIYGEKDEIDLAKMRGLGLPFWLAGGYATPEQLQAALDQGAAGIQAGTVFALSDESGMVADVRQQLREKLLTDDLRVFTDKDASPTGFPFKVVRLGGSIMDPSVYAERERICDMGFLRQAYKRDDGKIGYRCPAEPQEDYVRKGGKAEDTEHRVCLCNHLGATAGFAQVREDGYHEPALITLGNDVLAAKAFLERGNGHYSAKDVVQTLLAGIHEKA